MKAVRYILIAFLGLLLLSGLLQLAGIVLAIVKDANASATNTSYLLGNFVGTLLISTVFACLIVYLWKKNQPNSPPPPPLR